MSFSAGIRSLEMAVKRLEAAVGKGTRYCPRCRFMLRHSLYDPKKPPPPPAELLKATCEYCHSPYAVRLGGKSEEEREVFRLQYSFTLEEQYTNPKAHAFELWQFSNPRLRARPENRAQVKKVRNDSNVRTRDKLREELNNLMAEKNRRFSAKYGKSIFPEHTRLIKSILNKQRGRRKPSVVVNGLCDLERVETKHLIRAELEKIIWGRPEVRRQRRLRK